MAWTVDNINPISLGQKASYQNTWILSEVALAAGTVNLADLMPSINTLYDRNSQWAVISITCDAAAAGGATFNNSSTTNKRKVTLVAGENTRKPENSPYWFTTPGEGLTLTTDVTLNDVQIVVGTL